MPLDGPRLAEIALRSQRSAVPSSHLVEEELMDDRRLDQIADTIDDIAVVVEEIKEGRNCPLSEQQLDQVQHQLEDVRAKLDDLEDEPNATST
jgi:FtsZ-binding cell division protein ZapB